MSVRRWFERKRAKGRAGNQADDGAAITCKTCGAEISEGRLRANLSLCQSCGHHFYMPVEDRIACLIDEGTWESWSGGIGPFDVLGFEAGEPYQEKLAAQQARARRPDAIETGGGELDGQGVALVVLDFQFIGGSMASVVGEEFARAAKRAADEGRSLIAVVASGGARMHEGAVSLMQTAKTTVALEQLAVRRLPYVCVLTNPTTGGVTASFATLGDILLAEPGALISFAGPRVIQQTIRQELPDGFQRAEFLFERGMLDEIVARPKLKGRLSTYLQLLRGGTNVVLGSSTTDEAGCREDTGLGGRTITRVAQRGADPSARDRLTKSGP
jgi:acetyl-CoA carboxylase carboxyl transferase subunit beta